MAVAMLACVCRLLLDGPRRDGGTLCPTKSGGVLPVACWWCDGGICDAFISSVRLGRLISYAIHSTCGRAVALSSGLVGVTFLPSTSSPHAALPKFHNRFVPLSTTIGIS